MMKNKFFGSLSAKFALAAVALTTLTLTSCDKENFNTQVIYNPAKVTIIPQVMYVDMGLGTSQDVTSSASISFSGATASGNTATIEGTSSSPAIASATVTITAEYNGATGSTTITTPALQTGVVAMTPTIFILKESDYYIAKEVVTQTTGDKLYLTPNGHSYSLDGKQWIENPTEYFMTVSVKAPYNWKRELVGDVDVTDASVKTMVENLVAKLAVDKTTTEDYTFTVSAYSLFTAYLEPTITTYDYTVYKLEDGDETEVASFTMKETDYVAVTPVEVAHPSHASHYQHGHGHGNSDNAGGGIITAD